MTINYHIDPLSFDPSDLAADDIAEIRRVSQSTKGPFGEWLSYVLDEPGPWAFAGWANSAEAIGVARDTLALVWHARDCGSPELLRFAEWCHDAITLWLAGICDQLAGGAKQRGA